MRASVAFLVVALGACNRADDPRLDKLCRGVGATFQVGADALDRVCATPGACQLRVDRAEEEVGDNDAKAAIRYMRDREAFGEVQICAPDAYLACKPYDYPCLVRQGRAVSKALLK